MALSIFGSSISKPMTFQLMGQITDFWKPAWMFSFVNVHLYAAVKGSKMFFSQSQQFLVTNKF
jgi:hypothetical protein